MGQELLVVGGDGGEFVRALSDGSWENLAVDLGGGLGGLDLLGGSVVDQTLLGLAVLSGEEDELGLVGVKSINVKLELLGGGGGSALIDGDSDSAGEGGRETSLLEFTEGEAAAIPDLSSISARARGNDGSQLLDGSGEHSFALCSSLIESDSLLAWLVEVNSDSGLPVLAEMYVWDDVVVLDHC